MSVANHALQAVSDAPVAAESVLVLPLEEEFVGEACHGCGHKFHSLKECRCGCIGDETQSREAWESQRADDRWDAAMDAIWES